MSLTSVPPLQAAVRHTPLSGDNVPLIARGAKGTAEGCGDTAARPGAAVPLEMPRTMLTLCVLAHRSTDTMSPGA